MSSTSLLSLYLLLVSQLHHSHALPQTHLTPRVNNGLAITPPMGWNSYNHYSCSINETIIHSNAQALVSLGLASLGYKYVTPDCGWSAEDRSANGSITWNSTLFPSGFPALASYVHDLGLKFGVYSDSGRYMCNVYGENPPAGSLGYETEDAASFANWGVDALKYDNCYAEASAGYPDADYTPSESPSRRYSDMATAISKTGRAMLLQICEWGVDFPAAWAPGLGNTWRMSNDIIPQWSTVYRQVNQIVPQTSFAQPGAWPDLDMLEVGNNIFTTAEEQTHFTLWAICKSPLVIGGRLQDAAGSIQQSSLNILKNQKVISYNQDSLGVAANLTKRYTQAGLDVWSGPLSNGRVVAALVNWQNTAQTASLLFPDFGVQSAQSVYDVWQSKTTSLVQTAYNTTIPAHGVTLLELSGVSPAGTYAGSFATVSGSHTTFNSVYGISPSSGYSATISLASAPASAVTVTVQSSGSTSSKKFTIPAGAKSASFGLALNQGPGNVVSFSFPTTSPALNITKLSIVNPSGTFIPATSFTVSGDATVTTCHPGLCAPVGTKIGYLTPNGAATASLTRNSSGLPATTSGSSVTRYVELTYINNDIAFGTAFGTGRNARNITVAVNGATPVRLEVPLSGRSSELFSPGLGWQDSATLGLLVPGFGTGSGSDSIVVSNVGGAAGVVSSGADFVGLRVL